MRHRPLRRTGQATGYQIPVRAGLASHGICRRTVGRSVLRHNPLRDGECRPLGRPRNGNPSSRFLCSPAQRDTRTSARFEGRTSTPSVGGRRRGLCGDKRRRQLLGSQLPFIRIHKFPESSTTSALTSPDSAPLGRVANQQRRAPSAAVGRRNHAATRPTSFATSSRRSHTQFATVDHMFDSGQVRPCGWNRPTPRRACQVAGAGRPRQAAGRTGSRRAGEPADEEKVG